jgi:PAS domain S-box-containing protein
MTTTALRVLIVDDDEVDRLSVRRALATASTPMELHEAADAQAARAAIQKGGFDCVLLDFQLPQIDGLTLLRDLRGQGWDVPVVMLTGLGNEATAVELMKAGASDYLGKAGLSPVRLEQSITHAVRVYRAERSAAEIRTALKASERQYRFLAEFVPQIIWTARADGALDYCNQRMCDYTGLSVEEVIRAEWLPALHPEDIVGATASWRAALRTGEPYEDQFRLLRAADRSYRWHLGRAVPLQGADGTIGKWFGTCTDIDDQKRTATQLELERARVEEANRAKDIFLATVSHELRTPLNAVLGWVQILLSRPMTDDKRQSALGTIARNARAQAQLIDDLLDVSRISSGKLGLEVGPVDLIDVVESTIETVRPAADAKGLRLDSELQPEARTLVGDAGRLQQIVSNLLTNAVKFSETGGRVRIDLRRIDAAAELVVTDEGRGIDPEFLPYVFERFRQSDATIARSQGGLGLGLTIVRHLVELHGGTIQASSAGRGKGARFMVRLPLSAAAARVEAAADPRPLFSDARIERTPELVGLRILVVDDQVDARELVATILEDCQAKVSRAGSVPEALAVFERSPPDLLISDLGMPDETGYDLIRQIRSRSLQQGGQTPALALTAYARAVDRTQALRAGFNMHLAKPLDPAELVAIVAALSGRLSRAKPPIP